MHRIAASILASTFGSLLVLAGGGACGGAKDEGKAETKGAAAKAPAEPKTPEAKVAQIVAPVPGAAPTPAPAVEPAPAPEPPKAEDHGQELCETIIPCFQKLEFSGSFSADVTADIEPDGSVSAVSFTGQAPKPVQTCITDAIKGITLADYNGKPGRVRCMKNGQLMGGTQMIMSDRTYELRDAGPGKAEADPGKADAKAEAGKAG